MSHGGRVGNFLQRIFGDFFNRQFFVHDAIDKRGIGAIFQQSPDQVGQKILVVAYRCINTACEAFVYFKRFGIQVFAHAVQSLKLKIQAVTSQLGNDRNGMCVVGRKLRIKSLPTG